MSKKILPLLLACTLLYGCASNAEKAAEEWDDKTTISTNTDAVKRVVEKRYNADGELEYTHTKEYDQYEKTVISRKVTSDGSDDFDNVIKYTYDENGRLIKHDVTNGYSLTYEYYPNGNLFKEVVYSYNYIDTTYKYEYDSHNNEISCEEITYDENGNAEYEIERTEYEYDADGNQILCCNLDEDGKRQQWHRYEYDSNGNIIIDQYITQYGKYENEPTEKTYDENGNLILSLSHDSFGDILRRTEYEYDSKGNNTLKKYYYREALVYYCEYEYTELA